MMMEVGDVLLIDMDVETGGKRAVGRRQLPGDEQDRYRFRPRPGVEGAEEIAFRPQMDLGFARAVAQRGEQ